MEDAKGVVTFRIGRRELAVLAALALVCFHPDKLATESLTMTTYYPSPYGVYNEMRSQNNTFLAYTGGQVGVGTNASSPNVKLNVVGNMGVSGYGLIDNLSVGHTNAPSARIDLRNGELAWAGGRSRLKEDQGGSLELGGSGTGPSGTPYIDFHFAGSGADYSARIINLNNGLYIQGGGAGDDGGFLGNSCKMVWFPFPGTTTCPANWTVSSFALANGRMFDSPGGGAMTGLPVAGFMLCCKLQSY